MSALKMVLHGEKTSKTTIQKILSKSQKFARKASVVKFRYSQNTDHSNHTYDSEAYDLMKPCFQTSHTDSVRTTTVELFCGNGQRI